MTLCFLVSYSKTLTCTFHSVPFFNRKLGLHKFSLQVTIDHNRPPMYSGHYTASINCCKKTFYCKQNYGVRNDWHKKLLCFCDNVYIDYIMFFGLEQEDGSFDNSHGAGTSSPSHQKQVEELAPKPLGWMICLLLGAVSIRKTVLPGMAIPMLKIRRPNGRLIFNMEIAIRR